MAFERRESTDGRVAEAGSAVLFQTDGRSATQRAAGTGIADLGAARPRARLRESHATGDRRCAPGRCRCRSGCRRTVAGSGFAVSLLRDVPGLPVMRTVAMLANEAADAVNQGVCDAPAADAAMRLV